MLAFYSILSVSAITEFMSETIITNISGNIKLLICMFIIFRFFTKRIIDADDRQCISTNKERLSS